MFDFCFFLLQKGNFNSLRRCYLFLIGIISVLIIIVSVIFFVTLINPGHISRSTFKYSFEHFWSFNEKKTLSNGRNECLSFETELHRVRKGPFGIPTIIHQIYASSHLPLQYMTFLTKCRRLNKDFVHVLWTDADFERFLRRKRPEWLPIFKK